MVASVIAMLLPCCLILFVDWFPTSSRERSNNSIKLDLMLAGCCCRKEIYTRSTLLLQVGDRWSGRERSFGG